MIRRTLYLLTILSSLVMVGTTAAPALASTTAEQDAAATAVSRLLAEWNGALFNTTSTSSDCPQTNTGNDGNCWWWGAVTWNALITRVEDTGGVSANSTNTTIASDLWSTYQTICNSYVNYSPWGPCPTSANQNGKDPFTINEAGNTYFDDIGWWAQTWLNAYELVGRPYYLYLAEELWNYVTNNGFKTTTCNSGTGNSIGVVQYHKSDGTIGDPDIFANALYLRNSAWLYSITGSSDYMAGVGGDGGALNSASWIRQHLIFVYSGAVGSSGAQFMMADHYSYNSTDSKCESGGAQWQLHGQGEMVQAWADLATACGTYSCNAPSGYYNSLADELANSVMGDQPCCDSVFYPNNPPPPNQAEPTVDSPNTSAGYQYGVLTEPCVPPSGSTWPYGCDQGTDVGSYKSWLISKGVFEQAIYCLSNQYGDSQLGTFISQNASAIATLSHFGFWWDNSSADATVVISATQTSVLNGLDAEIGGSYAMC